MRPPLLPLLALVSALVAGTLGLQQRAIAASTYADVEPNNACLEAQDLGQLDSPLTVTGTLDGTAEPYPPPGTAPNIDFFRVGVPAGASLEIALGGSSSGQGTLEDPFIYAFTPECQLFFAQDWGGAGLDVRAIVEAPLGDALIIAVTSCCGPTTSGGPGQGSYTLTVTERQPIAGIVGQIVDQATGAAPAGIVTVRLLRCEPGETFCFDMNSTTVGDGSGSFSFTADYSGRALYPGSYIISVFGQPYEALNPAPFDVAAGELKDLGTLTVRKQPVIGSVSGRLVDAVSGEPISSATVYLNACDDFGSGEFCFRIRATITTGADGNFSFSPADTFDPLIPGRYKITYSADQYNSADLPAFSVGEDEHVALGTIAVEPFAVRITEATGCSFIPASGGVCEYRVRLVNGQRNAKKVHVWSVINTFGSFPAPDTTFQPEAARTISLKPGESRVVRFRLPVPAAVRPGTIFSAEVLASPDTRAFYFEPANRRTIFSAYKDFGGTFQQLPEEAARELQQQLRGVPAERRGRR